MESESGKRALFDQCLANAHSERSDFVFLDAKADAQAFDALKRALKLVGLASPPTLIEVLSVLWFLRSA